MWSDRVGATEPSGATPVRIRELPFGCLMLRETREMLSPLLPTPPQRFLSADGRACNGASAQSIPIGCASTRIMRQLAGKPGCVCPEVSGEEGRARTEEGVDDDVAAIAEVEEGVLKHGGRLDGRMVFESSTHVGAERRGAEI